MEWVEQKTLNEVLAWVTFRITTNLEYIYKEVQLWSAVSDNNILKCFTTQDIMEHGTTKCICSLCITMYCVSYVLSIAYLWSN